MVRRARNDVEDVSVFYEGNAICSRRGLLILVEDNPDLSGFWCVAKTKFITILTLFEGGLLCPSN